MQIAIAHPALNGVQRGMQEIRQAAARLASPEAPQSTGETLSALLALHEGKAQALLSLKALQAEDALLGRLLDVTA